MVQLLLQKAIIEVYFKHKKNNTDIEHIEGNNVYQNTINMHF